MPDRRRHTEANDDAHLSQSERNRTDTQNTVRIGANGDGHLLQPWLFPRGAGRFGEERLECKTRYATPLPVRNRHPTRDKEQSERRT
ncbi:MAG: hypothetical protein C4334_14240 [Pyrinomonas sp.]